MNFIVLSTFFEEKGIQQIIINSEPCAGVFVATPLTVAVIVFVGVVEAAVKIIAVAVVAVVFPLLIDVFIAGKCTNDSNCPKSSASLSIPPTKSTRPLRAYHIFNGLISRRKNMGKKRMHVE